MLGATEKNYELKLNINLFNEKFKNRLKRPLFLGNKTCIICAV